MGYNVNRLVSLMILLAGDIGSEKLFEVILKEAMTITNCDGGTLYTLEGDQLVFRHVYTKSKYVEMTSSTGATRVPPVPMLRSYVCAYSAIMRKRMNIPDVYRSNEFDFTGTKDYDRMNHYRTQSMLVMPMVVSDGSVMGVIQLINAIDSHGAIQPFAKEDETVVTALCSIAALYIENWMLKRRIARLEHPEEET